jgi:hypothetical protein
LLAAAVRVQRLLTLVVAYRLLVQSVVLRELVGVARVPLSEAGHWRVRLAAMWVMAALPLATVSLVAAVTLAPMPAALRVDHIWFRRGYGQLRRWCRWCSLGRIIKRRRHCWCWQYGGKRGRWSFQRRSQCPDQCGGRYWSWVVEQ